MTGQPPKRTVWPWWLLGGVVLLLITIGFTAPRDRSSELSLGDFQSALIKRQVSRVIRSSWTRCATPYCL